MLIQTVQSAARNARSLFAPLLWASDKNSSEIGECHESSILKETLTMHGRILNNYDVFGSCVSSCSIISS